MIDIILWIIFGAIIGFIADLIDKSVTLSWAERIVVGVVGAVIGGTLANLLTGSLSLGVAAGFNLVSMILAVVGALIAIFVWKRVVRRKTVV